MKLYLYCLIDEDASIENVIYNGENEGISGTPVTLLCLDDFALLVSDFAGASVAVTRDNVLKHAAIVGSLLPFTTPLPFRFGTLATEAELDSYLTARSKALQAKFEVVRGCVEMNVKIIWDRKWTEEKSEVEMKPGTAFLREKKREIFGSEARSAEAKRIAGWLEERVGESVRETRINTNTTDKLLVTAAHLVERGAIDRYRSAVKNAQADRPELHFLASGPWPPYSFANIDLEFKTQFGVS
ncbi:MAG TPA: GvpL/GvpF family gas vesicle protein [Pyrinomonadaceae bacterium]|nr:GvpL/GvpF family gas vesicle protein [Pyrinomonadaceae bacterium]